MEKEPIDTKPIWKGAPPFAPIARFTPVSEAGTNPADESRGSYPHFLTIPTRWADNDVYGHVNNVEYYAFFDTVINKWLIAEGGLDIQAREPGDVIGLCVESQCSYKAGFSFPEDVEAGLRVGKLGNTSVRYEIGLFAVGADEPSATGSLRARLRRRGTRAGRPRCPSGCATASNGCARQPLRRPPREGPHRAAARDGSRAALRRLAARSASRRSSSLRPAPASCWSRSARPASATPTSR